RAEFLAHYYEKNARPLNAYAFGMIDRWLRLGAVAPQGANLLMRTPGIAGIVKRALHIAPERELPRLAPVTFRHWARTKNVRAVGHGGRSGDPRPPAAANDVILWVDTFNNYFHPETSQAALDVLQSA